MKQITEDYVSEEVAKLLQMKGFDEPCDSYYEWFESGVTLYKGYMPEFYHGRYKPVSDMLHLKRPTHQMSLKWLMEVHSIYITSEPDINDKHCFYPVIYTMTEESWDMQCFEELEKLSFDKPEQAVEAAILYVLKNLI